ncbi:zonular occludens toxin domain-containing protein [Xanthomonas arboricola]|uniref:zonular occludens toxin domain-containing protein n=1 Tax=Xanthomonas arboricola TaxID=56448 RepID=UPI00404085F3
MIVGKEGQPRSGKSFETVKYDIVEALKAKRRTYARLNGLNHEKIAEHLQMPVEQVRSLLTVMNDNQVHEWLVCDTQEDGSLVFPHIEKGSLIVVDEVHEYWPTGRAAIPKPNADFFAKHGHIGLDVVLMSQDFKEVHRSVIRRMQRKNLYTKLDALGKDESYSLRYYTASTAGKFELTGSEKRSYDPAIYPLYHGIQPGVGENPVYKTGSRTIWQTAKKPAIAMALGTALGIYFIVRFFTGGGMTPEKAKDTAKQGVQQAQTAVVKAVPSIKPPINSAPTTPISAKAPIKPETKEEEKLPPGMRYVLDLAAAGRTRYSGSVGEVDLIEFRGDGGGQVMERLTTKQLWALGWSVTRTEYGALLAAKDRQIIATSWPIDVLGVQSVQTTDRIRAAAGSPVARHEQQPTTAANLTGTTITKAMRSQGTFPESAGYKAGDTAPTTLEM